MTSQYEPIPQQSPRISALLLAYACSSRSPRPWPNKVQGQGPTHIAIIVANNTAGFSHLGVLVHRYAFNYAPRIAPPRQTKQSSSAQIQYPLIKKRGGN